MYEIDMSKLSAILPLFPDAGHHMSLQAAAEGKAKTQVWVDSIDAPGAAAACFGIRLLIGGNPRSKECRDAVTGFLQNIVLRNQIERMRHFLMAFWGEPGWREVIFDAFSEYHPAIGAREYYRLDTSLKPCNNSRLPEGYELRSVDEAFLKERDWKNKRALQYEMCSERADICDFLEHSFGVCAVRGDEIAGWCLSEYNNSRGCEVGIEVIEGHQRKGIGTALALALVEEARKRGLRYVGWSCSRDNIPSSGTARKAGFSKLKDYEAIVVQR